MVEESDKRGFFSPEERQKDHTYSAGGNAAIEECWDIGYRSLVSCNFSLRGLENRNYLKKSNQAQYTQSWCVNTFK